MAEMSVHQTRAYFKRTLGEIVDRPEVGQQLTEVRAVQTGLRMVDCVVVCLRGHACTMVCHLLLGSRFRCHRVLVVHTAEYSCTDMHAKPCVCQLINELKPHMPIHHFWHRSVVWTAGVLAARQRRGIPRPCAEAHRCHTVHLLHQDGLVSYKVFHQPKSDICSSIKNGQVQNVCAGEPLTGDAWVARLRTPLEEAVNEERTGYERGLAAGPKYPVCIVVIWLASLTTVYSGGLWLLPLV